MPGRPWRTRLPSPFAISPPRDRLSTLGLTAATFFIVSGGPYGLEEIVLGQGYAGAIALLAAVPIAWSLPVALMVGELGAALPATGGYYVWVRRALGPFWGLQEAWLSLAVGIVNIAIYPVLFATYLSRFWPALGGGAWLPMAAIAIGTAWNALGIRSVGRFSTLLGALLLAPFAAMLLLAAASLPGGGLAVARAAFRGPAPAEAGAAAAGLLTAMWNLMGFDNASTFAGEVRDPGKSYPRAMALATAAIAAVYIAPVLAASVAGLPAAAWSTGSWVDIGDRLGGRALAAAAAAGGAISAIGMFVALLLSWSRLPVALAEDRWLPRGLGERHARTHAPVRAVVLGGALSAACVGMGFRQLVEINVILYGAGLVLELAALVALRIREPRLPRPFKIPGGLALVIPLALAPALLLAAAGWLARGEPGPLGMSAASFSAAVALLGPAWWAGDRLLRRRPSPGAAADRDA